MIDFDPDKDAINRGKHELMLGLGAEIFDQQYIEEEDVRVDYGKRALQRPAPWRRWMTEYASSYILGAKACAD